VIPASAASVRRRPNASTRRLLRGILLDLTVALGFTALAAAWTFPLVLHLSTHLPGTGIGDNAVFLWDFWWMRAARASGASFFHTSHLLAPAGADLTLHTHTALPAYVGATVLGGLSATTALNVTTLASLALNGFCTYLLAWRAIRQRGGAILAGIIFATSPYIAAHLNGHFNLTTAWTIPLFALGVVDAIRGSVKWAIFSGVVLAATAYIDYYYVVYEIAFLCCVLLVTARVWSVGRFRRPLPMRWLIVLLGAIGLDLALMAGIVATGGLTVRLGPVQVAAHSTFNALQLLWALIALALWFGPGLGVRTQTRDAWSGRRAIASVAIMGGILLAGAAPLVLRGFHLIAEGQYVTQLYQWRNAPVGIDMITLMMGNPFHSFWGGSIRHVYARFGIDLVESGAWLGIVPVGLAVFALRRRRADPIARFWVVPGVVFFVWALGSHVHVAGSNTGLIMPEALIRYVPIAANARMPGRAMVVVYLALAMVAAAGTASRNWRRPTAFCAAMAVAVLAECWIAPLPLASTECPPIYQVLRDRPERGALAELPLGLGDGFGDITPLDRRMLVCQTVHERPLVGGFLARLPASVMAAYRADPLIAAWLRLSGARADAVGNDAMPDAAAAGPRMDRDGIAFVLLNRRTASAQLREYVEHVLPLAVVSEDAERTLFVRIPPVRKSD
jgi:hypothetical protein